MGCSCKDMRKEISDYKNQIDYLRELFIKRMIFDSKTKDRRRKDYNQAIFCDFPDKYGKYKQARDEITLDMVLQCFDNAVKDWRKQFCNIENCNRK